MCHHRVNTVGGGVGVRRAVGAGGRGGGDHPGDEFADDIVACGDEQAGPIGAVGGPAIFPRLENGESGGAKRGGAGDAHGILIGEKEEGLGAGDERVFALVA